jgi:hypothetical protein
MLANLPVAVVASIQGPIPLSTEFEHTGIRVAPFVEPVLDRVERR